MTHRHMQNHHILQMLRCILRSRADLMHRWREEDMEQVSLDNACFLWDQFASRNIMHLVGPPYFSTSDYTTCVPSFR